MGHLAELFAVDHKRAFEFFLMGLNDVCDRTVSENELMYNASVLAHYAQTSTQSEDSWPTPSTLSDVFDTFVIDRSLHQDSSMMEIAGAECLLLTGFFGRQMQRRHNISWYSKLGAGYFNRAAIWEKDTEKARLLRALASNFESWRQRHKQLSCVLRDQRYLLSTTPEVTPQN